MIHPIVLLDLDNKMTLVSASFFIFRVLMKKEKKQNLAYKLAVIVELLQSHFVAKLTIANKS